MIENMEWYKVFHEVAQTGSFSKAAERLFITQPAVSHAIKQLEFRLGGPLFVRTSRGARLTPEGEVLLKFVAHAHHLLENGEKKIAEMRQLMAGEVRIGAGDTLCRYYLLPALDQFHRLYPEVKLQVTNRTSRETVALLKDGRIDFGVVNLPLDDRQLLVRESIELHDCFVAGAAHASATEIPLSWEALAKLPLIMLEQGSSMRRHTDEVAQQHGVRLRPEIELGSLELIAQFSRIGLGVGCVIREFVQAEIAEGKLQEVPLAEPIPARCVGLVTLRDVPLSAAAQRMLELLP